MSPCQFIWPFVLCHSTTQVATPCPVPFDCHAPNKCHHSWSHGLTIALSSLGHPTHSHPHLFGNYDLVVNCFFVIPSLSCLNTRSHCMLQVIWASQATPCKVSPPTLIWNLLQGYYISWCTCMITVFGWLRAPLGVRLLNHLWPIGTQKDLKKQMLIVTEAHTNHVGLLS